MHKIRVSIASVIISAIPVITYPTSPNNPSLLALTKNFGSINGFVRDASNGERLAYANILIKGTALGGSSNDKGYYFIENIAPGKYIVAAVNR